MVWIPPRAGSVKAQLVSLLRCIQRPASSRSKDAGGQPSRLYPGGKGGCL